LSAADTAGLLGAIGVAAWLAFLAGLTLYDQLRRRFPR
jgi:hypothetical protein